MLKNDIELLKQEFKRIKDMGLVKSLRKGTSGLGYTFETLLGKEEDKECKPDFGSIELKCKLGYTKSPITLFNCAPMRNGESATRYIFEKYSYHCNGDVNAKMIFSRSVFADFSKEFYGHEFKLKVDYYQTRVIMQVFSNGEYFEDVCYWDFDVLEHKLKQKLQTLAIVEGYPYTYDKVLYYKYFRMRIYKLRGFFEFLKLIENGKIMITFYIKDSINILGNPNLDTHGIAFRIRKENIPKLFYEIKY